MHEKEMIWSAVIFGTILLVFLGGVLISFLFMYQRKKYRHEQEVQQMKENFTREMLHSKTEIQEQTLQHIATEIHDNFIPTLSVINLDLAGVVQIVEEPVRATIVDAKILVKQLMAEMKDLSMTMNTDQISKRGFTRTLEDYIARLIKTGYCKISFTKEGMPYRLPPAKELILFRMCQEALNNIVKHANAANISVALTYAATQFQVTITDDGAGFDSNSLFTDSHKADSSGLQNMRNRAQTLEAELTIESKPGSGTRIAILLPI